MYTNNNQLELIMEDQNLLTIVKSKNKKKKG